MLYDAGELILFKCKSVQDQMSAGDTLESVLLRSSATSATSLAAVASLLLLPSPLLATSPGTMELLELPPTDWRR